jgi:hypothetical protein
MNEWIRGSLLSLQAFNYETRKFAILSQEESAVWVGDFDPEALDFASEEGQVFHLPRDNHCEVRSAETVWRWG